MNSFLLLLLISKETLKTTENSAVIFGFPMDTFVLTIVSWFENNLPALFQVRHRWTATLLPFATHPNLIQCIVAIQQPSNRMKTQPLVTVKPQKSTEKSKEYLFNEQKN